MLVQNIAAVKWDQPTDREKIYLKMKNPSPLILP